MKLKSPIGIILLMLYNIPSNYGYNILALFPHPGISHFYFFQPLLKELAKRGHHLTVVSNFPEKNPIPNYTDIPIGGSILKEGIDLNIIDKLGRPPLLPTFFLINNWGLESCENVLKSDATKKILNPNLKFDLILIEQFNNDCMLSFAHLKNAPVIGLSSSGILPWHHPRMSSPFITSYMPNIFSGPPEKMDFMLRLQNWYYYHGSNLLYNYLTQPATNKIIQKYISEPVPDLRELANNIKLILVNQHFSLSGPKPWSPSIIEVSGLQIEKPKPLNEKFQKILDSAKSGVIYISWGSLIRSDTLPEAKREALLKALGRLEQTVLWKWENESMPNCPKNVFVFKWMPQQDILSHPNVKVFMNHGGLLGTTESVSKGVPMVTTPILGDQFYNTQAIINRKIGVELPFNEITEENVLKALKTVLKPEYQMNAKLVAEAFNSRPDTPLSTAVWWIEHVGRTKGEILTESIAIELPWYIYYNFDIYALIVLVIISIYYFIKLLIKFINYIRGSKQKKIKQK